eukprot:scaffold2645_cov378-Prasinococcus_capsulatus_cf.AAC.9
MRSPQTQSQCRRLDQRLTCVTCEHNAHGRLRTFSHFSAWSTREAMYSITLRRRLCVASVGSRLCSTSLARRSAAVSGLGSWGSCGICTGTAVLALLCGVVVIPKVALASASCLLFRLNPPWATVFPAG